MDGPLPKMSFSMKTPILLVLGLLPWGSLLVSSVLWADEPAGLRAGFAAADITPELSADRPVWLAGYGAGRQATGIHDPLMARTVVLSDGSKQIGLVSVDLIGLQFPSVQRIRQAVPELDYVLVASTHNHEGPDVIGIWGPTLFKRGVDEAYLELVERRVVETLKQAAERLEPVRASFGAAADDRLLNDSRPPLVKDGVLRAVRFETPEGRTAGLVVVWNCHPEALGSRNTLLTADFPATTVERLRARHNCPVVYFSGALGGLMAPPREGVTDAGGRQLEEGQFEYAERYGHLVADLAERALLDARPLDLTPLHVAALPVMIPVTNPYYRAARSFGVLSRESFLWTGDFSRRGERVRLDTADQKTAVETEVACLRLGRLHVAAIPGEIYPELVYGKYQEPVDPGADFPDAPLEPPVSKILPSGEWLLLGLANDEIGYIIPLRQWDQRPPFTYQRISAPYGEINSCSSDVAPIVMQALERAVKQLPALAGP